MDGSAAVLHIRQIPPEQLAQIHNFHIRLYYTPIILSYLCEAGFPALVIKSKYQATMDVEQELRVLVFSLILMFGSCAGPTGTHIPLERNCGIKE